jgi:hypothetical protein
MAYADASDGSRIILQGIAPSKITLADSCKPGDVLGYSSGWKRALATVSSVVQGRLVAGALGASGDVITAYRAAVVSGVSGATAGNPIYVAEGSDNGQTTETAPNTTNDADTVIGIALTATEVFLFPGTRADSLA